MDRIKYECVDLECRCSDPDNKPFSYPVRREHTNSKYAGVLTECERCHMQMEPVDSRANYSIPLQNADVNLPEVSA